MDYIDTLLIIEDDLDEDDQDAEMLGAFYEPNVDTLSSGTNPSQSQNPSHSQSDDPHPTLESVPAWCTCVKCRPMPQEIENRCCKQKKCITLTSRFAKLCLDPDVLELCIRNRSDIRNDREDNSTRAFRKACYRQFILARHGYLAKGNRRVCPSCVVLKIREWFPSVTVSQQPLNA
ncbi:uncharacterized protein LOC114535334 [Dendronephthya gigantea]|uniref:uncharacterized protein LOC114535334 n=1 Tax=Dendronephthya gigantea TaxID=151771 RepID=UPI00106B96DF|nr:uncharacterized protein LOC114535334 [Dendronephthya gigantea]